MSNSVDPNTRVISNTDKAELLEIKHKRVLIKRIRNLEADVEQLKLLVNKLMESNTSVL